MPASDRRSHALGGGLLQCRGAEDERTTGNSPEYPLDTDTHIHQVGGALQRRGGEEESAHAVTVL